MVFILLTLASIQLIEGSLLRLGRYYLFQDRLDLTFHCGTSQSNLTQIIIKSDNKCNIDSENNFTQIGSDDNHCIIQTILELYMFQKCQTSMSINCNGQFAIVQTIYNPIELEKTYINNRNTITRTNLIKSLTFSIHEEELLIILLENEQELFDSYRIILTRLDDPSNELAILQSNLKTYFQVLSKGRYQLFIIGQLFYNIYFQNELIQEHFIFSKSEVMEYQNLTFFLRIGLRLKVYLILHQGKCEIQSTYDQRQQTIQLREGIYLLRFENLQIKIISQPLVIAIMYDDDTILFYPTNLYIINHTPDTTAYIWTKYNIRIHRMDQRVQILQTYLRDIKVTIFNLNEFGINEFRIELEIIHINTEDIFYLSISTNTTLICTCNLAEYSFQRISGEFQYEYANKELQIQTSKFTILKFIRRFIHITDLMLNEVYKIQSSNKFRVMNVKHAYLKVFTYPEIDIRTYYDYEQKQHKEFINKKIVFEYHKPLYTYIVATSDKPFYIYIFNFQDNNFQYPKVILRLNYIVFMNELHQNFQVITPDNSLNIIETNNGNFTSFQFDQENSLACLIQYWDQRFIQININELQYIDKGKSYVIYFQQDILLIVLESQINSFELQIEIIKTDVNQLPRLSKDYEDSLQEYPFNDECFKISFIGHMYFDLRFFDCQKFDCIVNIQNSKQSTNIQFLTCVEAELGLVEVQKHLFTCQSLFDKDILHIRGQISVDKAANYIHCKSENCLVLIIDNRQILENFQLDQFIQVNQVYRNLSHNEFIFYNNQTQILKIHSDQQWSLHNIDEMKIDIMFKLEVGYYYLTFTQNPSYIVIFTVPKRLYQNLTYTFTNQEEFIILNNKNSFILEFYNSSNIEICIDNRREFIIGTLVQSVMPINKTITFIGDGTFMVYYVDSICYFIEEPKVLVFYNKTIKIEIQLNDDCNNQFIELQLNNSTLKQITGGNSFQIDSQYLQLTNQLQYDILSNKIFQLVKTDEYIYHFNYKTQLEYPFTSTYPNILYLTFILLLILLLHKIIKFHRQVKIHECQMIIQDQG